VCAGTAGRPDRSTASQPAGDSRLDLPAADCTVKSTAVCELVQSSIAASRSALRPNNDVDGSTCQVRVYAMW